MKCACPPIYDENSAPIYGSGYEYGYPYQGFAPTYNSSYNGDGYIGGYYGQYNANYYDGYLSKKNNRCCKYKKYYPSNRYGYYYNGKYGYQPQNYRDNNSQY